MYISSMVLYIYQLLRRLKEEIENMRPPADNLENFRLLLVGPVGSGKSSFFNTVASVFRGRITQGAMVGEGTHSVTTAVNYKLRYIQKCRDISVIR